MEKLAWAAIGALLVSACSSKTDASEKNFSVAISKHLEDKGELCIARGRWKDPSQVYEDAPSFISYTKELDVLERLGLVKSTEAEQVNNKTKFKKYGLTDTGKKFYRANAQDGGMPNSALCYGRKTLDKVVKWEGPMKFGDYQAATVTYKYKIDNLADWAKTPEFQAEFKNGAAEISGAGRNEQQIGVTLTSLGWEAK